MGAKIALSLLESGCKVFRNMTFLVDGSPAIANGLLFLALDDVDAYCRLLQCGYERDLGSLSMDPHIMASAPEKDVLAVVKKVQLLLYAMQEEVLHMTTGKVNPYSIGPEPDPNSALMDFDFNLGDVAEDPPKPDEKDKGHQSD